MNRYSIINKANTHACMEQSPAGDWVTYQEAQQLEHELNAANEKLMAYERDHATICYQCSAAMPNDPELSHACRKGAWTNQRTINEK